MKKTAVIYWSGTGNTEQMAEAVFAAAKEANPDAQKFAVNEITAADAAEYDVLLLGCPAMGAEELEESEFAPFFEELEPSLGGKAVALFGSYGWGDGEWMRSWEDKVTADGAVLISDSIIANDVPDDEAIAKCRELGKRSAE